MDFKELKHFIEELIPKQTRNISIFDMELEIKIGYYPTDISMAGLSMELPAKAIRKLKDSIPNSIYCTEKPDPITGGIMRFTTIKKISGSTIDEIVENFIHEYGYGLIQKEMQYLIDLFPDINMKKFNDAMMGNTCMMSPNKEFINYHCDVRSALYCGIENRDLTIEEWD